MNKSAVPPGPKGDFIVGCGKQFARDRVRFLTELRRDYGEMVRLKVWGRTLYLVTNPDYVKEVLVNNHRNFTKSRALKVARYVFGDGLLTSEGEVHRRQRRMMQPNFHSQRINAYGEIMIDYALRHAERWQDEGLEGGTVDIAHEMMKLTLAIVGKTLFDADVENEAEEIGAALTTVIGLFERVNTPAVVFLTLLPTPKNIKFLMARARIDKTVYRIINERRASGKDHGDLLSMLLAAQDEDDGAGMSDKQIRDEAITLFLAGHETTANALTWTWYLLSQHPDVEARMHAELDEMLGGEAPTPADVSKLEYTRRVFAESMRLYPPAYVIGRQALEEFELGGYTIPADSIILLSPFLAHRDPNEFPDPETFDPDRWAPELQKARHKFAYFPFGGGPRTCIGEPFAWMEGILLLAVIAQRWQMRMAPGNTVEFDPQITLRPKGGMPMVLSRRTTAVESHAMAK